MECRFNRQNGRQWQVVPTGSMSSPGWQHSQFHRGFANCIRDPNNQKYGAHSSDASLFQFSDNCSQERNNLKLFSQLQYPSKSAIICSSLPYDMSPTSVNESQFKYHVDDNPFNDHGVTRGTEKMTLSDICGIKNGSLSSSLFADLTKEWSPYAAHCDENYSIRENQLHSVSIQTDKVLSVSLQI